MCDQNGEQLPGCAADFGAEEGREHVGGGRVELRALATREAPATVLSRLVGRATARAQYDFRHLWGVGTRQGGVGTRRRFRVVRAAMQAKTTSFCMAHSVHRSVAMDAGAIAAIDVAEAAYDLQCSTEAWLPNLLEKGAPLFDCGLGCAAGIWAGRSPDRQPLVAQLCAGAGSPELGEKLARAVEDVGPDLRQASLAWTSLVRTASESDLERPGLLRAFEKRVGCRDVLGLWAVDAGLHGVGIHIPSPQFISLSKRARHRWQRLAVHIEAGHRLRRRLGCAARLEGTPVTEIPIDVDAIIDPKGFVITHAKRDARSKDAAGMLRQAAIRVDRARSKLRKEDADKALEIWQGLVRGRWSLVDWFDSDGRRFVVVLPNAPGLSDPRGLTEREEQVTTLAARGDSSKSIRYRLGISPQRVSMLLHSAMRKLCVKTQPELVMKMRAFQPKSKDAA